MIYAQKVIRKKMLFALSLSPFFFVSFRKDKNASTRRGVVVAAEAFFLGERKKGRKEGRKEDDVSKKRHKKCRFFPR